MRVLVIDDEPSVAEVVELSFKLLWPQAVIRHACDAASGLRELRREPVELVILDIGLPDRDGFELCREIRSFSQVPIIMLTVRDSEVDKVKGLELGADDYITKPFSPMELVARVKALWRRLNRGEEQPRILSSGGLRLDPLTGEVWLEERRLKLTPVESKVLEVLMRHAGQTVPRRVLLSEVWGPNAQSFAIGALKVHIRHLRRKLEPNPNAPRIIVTERNVGYRLIPPSTPDS